MSNTFTLDAPEDIGGTSDYMREPGVFHFTVLMINANKTPKGDMMDGFSFELEALSGKEVGKKVSVSLYNGKMTHKDGGLMSRRKQAAFLIATNVLSPLQLGQKGVSIDLDKAVGSQLCAEFELSDPKDDGKRYLEIRYANFYHVDDPRAANIPKSAEALGVIGDTHRHDANYFKPLQSVKKTEPKPPVSDDDFAGL